MKPTAQHVKLTIFFIGLAVLVGIFVYFNPLNLSGVPGAPANLEVVVDPALKLQEDILNNPEARTKLADCTTLKDQVLCGERLDCEWRVIPIFADKAEGLATCLAK